MNLDTRLLPLEGAYNMRDIGGLVTSDGPSIRTGRLYRADSLHLLTSRDLEILAPHRIATVIDLRETYEIEATGRATLVDHGAEYLHLSLTGNQAPRDVEASDYPPSMAEGYLLMLESFAHGFINVLEAFASTNVMPAVFHCAGGKDRTGVLSAVIHLLLGVDESAIAEDYALTGQVIDKIDARYPLTMYPGAEKFPSWFFEVRAETMIDFIALLNHKYGSAEEFLLKAGLRPEVIATIRRELLL